MKYYVVLFILLCWLLAGQPQRYNQTPLKIRVKNALIASYFVLVHGWAFVNAWWLLKEPNEAWGRFYKAVGYFPDWLVFGSWLAAVVLDSLAALAGFSLAAGKRSGVHGALSLIPFLCFVHVVRFAIIVLQDRKAVSLAQHLFVFSVAIVIFVPLYVYINRFYKRINVNIYFEE